jgi:2-polyprenyl-3-methyl-5-hydroxy-6-metoxy-1,4-benzoquinol methylase
MAANHLSSQSSDKGYYEQARHEVLALIPVGTKRLLDVGCSNGATAALAKKQFGIEYVVGVELFPDAAETARKRLDEVIEGNIEILTLPYTDDYFDCIICADILEHTQNPWLVLTALRRLISPNGVVIASIPNIGHIVPLLKIAFDRFEYEESGILDKTHLRFFTLHTIKQMFSETGFQIEVISTNKSKSWKFAILKVLTLGLFERLSVVQYLVRAKKL